MPYNITGVGGAKDFYPLTTPSAPIPESGAFSILLVLILGPFVVGARRAVKR